MLIGALLVVILVGVSMLLKVPNHQLVWWWGVEILVLVGAGILSLRASKEARTVEQMKKKAEVLTAALGKEVASKDDAIEAAIKELKGLRAVANGLGAACENAKAELLSGVLDKQIKSARIAGVTKALRTTVQNYAKLKLSEERHRAGCASLKQAYRRQDPRRAPQDSVRPNSKRRLQKNSVVRQRLSVRLANSNSLTARRFKLRPPNTIAS